MCEDTTVYLSVLNRQSNGHLGSLQFEAIMDGGAMNILVHIF